MSIEHGRIGNGRGRGNGREQPLVLVTGSAGLIGSGLRAALSEAYRVVGLDVQPSPDGSPWIRCDLTDGESVQGAFEEVEERYGREVASVVHLAAYYDFSGEPSPLYRELTVEGTRRLLGALRSFRVEQLVFSSSLLVMKPAGEERALLDESSPLAAEWDYPRSKLATEALLREEHGEIPVVVLRIAGVYDEDGHSIPLAQQMRRIHEHEIESYFFPGDPDQGQPYVHLEDVARCVRAAVDRRRRLGSYETFLIGEPDVVTHRELQCILGEELEGRSWPSIRIPAPLAKAAAWIKEKAPGGDGFIKPWMIDLADVHRPIDIGKARRVLGWNPRHRLRDTLSEMARRLNRDPERWYAENGLEPPEGSAARAGPGRARSGHGA